MQTFDRDDVYTKIDAKPTSRVRATRLAKAFVILMVGFGAGFGAAWSISKSSAGPAALVTYPPSNYHVNATDVDSIKAYFNAFPEGATGVLGVFTFKPAVNLSCVLQQPLFEIRIFNGRGVNVSATSLSAPNERPAALSEDAHDSHSVSAVLPVWRDAEAPTVSTNAVHPRGIVSGVLEAILFIGSLAVGTVDITSVSNYRLQVLPQGSTFSEFSGWQELEYGTFFFRRRTLINLVGSSFSCRLHLIFGGSYHGVGQYIQSATCVPLDTSSAILVHTVADARIGRSGGAVNLGTESDPIAGATMTLGFQSVNGVGITWRSELDIDVGGDGSVVVHGVRNVQNVDSELGFYFTMPSQFTVDGTQCVFPIIYNNVPYAQGLYVNNRRICGTNPDVTTYNAPGFTWGFIRE